MKFGSRQEAYWKIVYRQLFKVLINEDMPEEQYIIRKTAATIAELTKKKQFWKLKE